jgi:hypothetical protein
MLMSVNDCLNEAKKTSAGVQKKRIPETFTDGEISAISSLVLILEPFADLTDDLQADTVTSSVIILGLLNAIKGNFKIYFKGFIFKDIIF